MKNTKLLRILNLLSFIIMLTINALANILPINGKTTGELSDSYPNLFVPAGFTFAIWGLIYTLLFIFCIYQLTRSKSESKFIRDIGYLFIFSCILNSAWIIAWHYEKIFITLVIMIALLLTLISIYNKLCIGIKSNSKKEKYLVHIPFSIYLGWISIATVANVTTFLVSINFNKWEVFFTIFVIVFATILSLLMLINRYDIFYSAVVIWAFIGILAKRLSLTPDLKSIIITLIICIALISFAIYNSYKKWLKY